MSLRTIIEFEGPLPDGTSGGTFIAHELDCPFDNIKLLADGRLVSIFPSLEDEDEPVSSVDDEVEEAIHYTGFIHLTDEIRLYILLMDKGVMTSIRAGSLEAFAPTDYDPTAVIDLLRMAYAEGRVPPAKSVRALLARAGEFSVKD